jgi:hypothetical protein
VEPPASVLPLMHVAQKTPRAPRLPAGRESSALAVSISNPNLAGALVATPEDAPTLEAAQRLVQYFDDRGGFWRVGHLIASRTVTHGRHKGQVILTIATVLNRRVTRNGDEVKWVR